MAPSFVRTVFRRFLLSLFLLSGLSGTANAVIVAYGDGTQNSTAPADNFGFANVGTVGGASGVYLGNGWMLSAYHVVANGVGGFNIGSVTLAGITYAADAATAARLANQDQSPADLAVFRLTSIPEGLPSVSIASTAPVAGSSVSMAGHGPDRAVNQTHWNIDTSTNPDTWTETTGSGDAQGYFWLNTFTTRWGINQVATFSGGSTTNTIDDGSGTTNAFFTTFNNSALLFPNEAQAGVGDSGGGVFRKTLTGSWELSGTMLAIGTLDGQPGNTAVFGDATYAADLSTYRSQILALTSVPEPVAGTLLLFSLPLLLRRRRAGRLQY